MGRRPLYRWKPGFYGLTQNYRAALFRIIHEIVFYGRGGYSWGEVYNFPIWLRNVTHKFIEEYITKEKEAQNSNMTTSSNGKSNTDLNWANPDKSKLNKPSKSIPAPKINLPSYVSKASKK